MEKIQTKPDISKDQGTKFGPFKVIPYCADRQTTIPNTDIVFNPRKVYLELSLSHPEEGETQTPTQYFKQIAEWIQNNPKRSEFIYAVTYKKMAEAATNYGFTIIEYPYIGKKYKEQIEEIYKKYRNPDLTTMGEIYFCYQTIDSFLATFLPKK